MTPEQREDKFCGSLLGLAVGDAMGMPTEGLRPYEVWSRFQKIDGFHGCRRTNRQPGSYTGVTQLALCQVVGMLSSDWDGPLVEAQNSGRSRWRNHEAAEAEFISRCVPLGLLSAHAEPDDDKSLLGRCKSACVRFTENRTRILHAFAVAWCIRELARNSSSMTDLDDLCLADGSMMARLVGVCRVVETHVEKTEKIDDKLSLRLDHVRRRIDDDRGLEGFVGSSGNSWRCEEAVPMAFMCFLRGPDDVSSVRAAATMGGASPLIAGLCGAMVGAYAGIGFIPRDDAESVENQARIVEAGRRLARMGS